MIERLLAAEAALARGDVDVAERLFAQVAEADPRNAIAVVGLARIAHREGRRDEAKDLAERALVIDREEAAAARLLRELLLKAPPQPAEPTPTLTPEPAVSLEPPPAVMPAATAVAGIEAMPAVPQTSTQTLHRPDSPAAPTRASAGRRPSILSRVRRWLAGLGRRS